MQCFMCNKPVIPKGGYFRTQLFNGKHICHVECKPQFHYDNKPEEDFEQTMLFPILDDVVEQGARNETKSF